MKRSVAWVSLLSLVAGPASADWYNVPSSGNVPPASGPECIPGYGDCPGTSRSGDSNSNSESTQSTESPEERAERQAAADRAAEAARKEALDEYEASADSRKRLARTGAALEFQARRFQEKSDERVRREEKAGSLADLLAPVGPPAGPPSPALSMKEYCRKLNAMAVPARGLHASHVPPLSPAAQQRSAAFWTPARHDPDWFGPALELANQEVSAAKAKAREDAEAAAWDFFEKRASVAKSIHEAYETYQKRSELVSTLAAQAFGFIDRVAATVGSGGGTATNQAHDELVGSMSHSVFEHIREGLGFEAPPPLEEVFEQGGQWGER